MKAVVNIGGLDYTIHSDGKIEKRRGKGFKKCFPDKDGYLKVAVPTKRGTYNEPLHRVMWRAFKGEIPSGMTVDHVDEDRSNNTLDNFQLLTPEENAVKGNAKNWVITDPKGIIYEVYNLAKFCRDFNLHATHMAEVAKPTHCLKQYKGWTCKHA